ncbi:MAG: hypothetical protein Q9227_007004 [Pyrenula ochraceoflavens]
MALSRRDAFLAGIGAFIAWGFAVSWLPILRFIGYAFVFGVVLTSCTLLFLIFTTSRRKQSDAFHAVAASSSFTFLEPGLWNAETTAFSDSRSYEPSRLYPPSFVISDALDGLLDLVLRDFVSSWYSNISKSLAFIHEVDRELRTALENIRDRLLGEDLVNIIVSRLVPIITSHLKEFDQAEKAVRGRNRNVTESEELDHAIANKYKDGKLHPAAALGYSDPKAIQQEYLRKTIVRILPEVLPEKSIKSRAVSVLIKEIVACAVLYPVMQMLADPDTWNQLIEAYGRAVLQDRKSVRKLRAALDEHASPKLASKQATTFPRLSAGDSERAFERFVKAIRRCNNLSDARQFRSQVASQLKRESEVENQDQMYLRRLETGKRVLDQKVNKLLFKAGNPTAALTQPDFRNGGASLTRGTTLVEVMHSAAGLSYFMEYMDRLSMMSLVQFWIVVDGFRDPLEDDFGEDAAKPGFSGWGNTSRTDIAQINEAYLSKPELKVPEDSRSAVSDFLNSRKNATALQYRKARTAILVAQSSVLQEMEHRYFPNFKKSELYYKYLTSDESLSTPSTQVQAQDHAVTSDLPSPVARLRPPPLARTASQPVDKGRNLRRAIASSTDIRSSNKLFEDSDLPKRSLERRSVETDRSAPLFDDDYDTDPLANSTNSLSRDSVGTEVTNREYVIESMESALNTIITENPKDEKPEELRESLFGSPISGQSQKSSGKLFDDSPRSSFEQLPLEGADGEKIRPSITSLGLVNSAGRIGVFTDDDLFPDEEKFIEDEYADRDESAGEENFADEIHEAAPGDLGLSEAIAVLTADLEKLVSQEAVVDTLTRKAELTNNTAELRILGKSKSSIQREMRRKELQRQQYIVQESDNSLYGRAHVRIKSIMVGKEDDGRQFALYLLEIQRRAGDAMPAASWAVARRYSEFHDLHSRLRARYPSVRNLEFPRRRMVMKLQKEFLHKRRIALEYYMQQLLLLPEVCRSLELRSFLSQQSILPANTDTTSPLDSTSRDMVSRLYNSVTEGMDDFLGNIAVLDQLSAAGQSLISAATSQLSTSSTMPNNPLTQGSIATPTRVTDSSDAAEAEAELNAYASPESSEAAALEPFVKPIADLFLETFELNRGNNWLRGRAVVLVLHQLLGGTIERRVRDAAKTFLAEDAILKYISALKDTMWPGGGKLRESKVRTESEKKRTRQEANLTLSTLMPELVGSVVGRTNAQSAARRVASCFNNGRLVSHVAFEVLDEIVKVLFGEERERG